MEHVKGPQADFTPGPECYSRFLEWEEECRLTLGGPLESLKQAVKANYVQIWAGKAGRMHLKSLKLTDAQKSDPEVIFSKLKEWTQPKSNELIAATTFRRLEQGNLTLSEYIDKATILCDQCNYPEDARDRLLRDAIVIGLRSKEAYYRCIDKGSALTLDEALNIARSHDDTMKQIDYTRPDLQGATAAEAHHISKKLSARQQQTSSRQQVHPKKKPCYCCGAEPSPKRSQCPAKDAMCHNCGRMGHFSKVCRSSKAKTKVHELQAEDQDEDPDQNDSYQVDDQWFYRDVHNIKTITIHSLNNPEHNTHIRPLWISRDASSQIFKIDCEVDTGAGCNILPLYKAKALFGEHLTLSPPTVSLLGYNDTPVGNLGSCYVQMYHGKKTTKVRCEVADSRGPILLGRKQALQMGYVSFPKIEMPPVQFKTETTIKTVESEPARSHSISINGKIHQLPTTKEYLLKEYADVFQGIGTLPGGDYHIQLKQGYKPVQHPPRHVAISLRPAYKAELKRLTQLGIITEVTTYTEWVNSIVPVKKSDGSLRLCLDPKDLNENIEGNQHYTRTIDDILPDLAEAKFMTLLDAKSGYWHVPLNKKSSFLTTFNTPWGKYRWLRLPFGLKVSGDEFQSRLDRTLRKLPNSTGIADDVLTFGKDICEHDAAVIRLLETARNSKLTFNEKKFVFRSEECPFFGGILTPEGYRADPKKIEAITKMEPPKDIATMQSFLGLVNYLNRFSPVLASLTAPLRILCKKDNIFSWESSQQAAFDAIKEEISRVPSLAYFDKNKTSVIQSDASMKGLGATLLQDGRPVVYASRSLTTAEQNYSNIERELLGVVFAVERFHRYIYGYRVKVQTDHKPLESIWKKPIAASSPRLQRLLLRLSQYNISIEYLKGKENVIADALSRVHPLPNDEEPQEDIIPVHLLTEDVPADSTSMNSFRRETSKDTVSGLLMRAVAEGWPDSKKDCHPLITDYWNYRDEISAENGLLFKGHRLIVPETLRNRILQTIHEGHFGIEKMQLRARESVFWPKITADVLQMAQGCCTCQTHSRSQKETLLQHEVPCGPWEKVCVDFFEFRSMQYLIVADYYSRFPVIRPATTTTTKATINILKQIFCEYDIPRILMSDNGPQFSSQEFKTFASEYKFKHITSSPRYPQSNGMIERMIQTIKQCMTRCHAAGEDPHIAMLVYRATPLTNSIPSPAELLNGRPYRALLPRKTEALRSDHQDIRERMILDKQRTAEHYNQDAKDLRPLHQHQRVVVQMNPNEPRWTPSTVTRIPNADQPRSYQVETDDGQTVRRNRRHIKPAEHDPGSMATSNPASACAPIQTDVQPEVDVNPPMMTKPSMMTNPPMMTKPSMMTNPPMMTTPAETRTRPKRETKKPERLIENF